MGDADKSSKGVVDRTTASFARIVEVESLLVHDLIYADKLSKRGAAGTSGFQSVHERVRTRSSGALIRDVEKPDVIAITIRLPKHDRQIGLVTTLMPSL